MEVLAVIALLGLVTAVVVTDFGALLDNAAQPTPYETLRACLDTGRRNAGTGATVRLTFDRDAGALRLSSPAGVQAVALPAGVTVDFALPADEAEGAERPLEAMTFYGAGCATPALVTLTVAGEKSRYRVEPFSAALSAEPAP